MWLCGCVVVWLCGCVVVWPCGCVTVWLCDRVAVWLCGYVAVWLCGRVAVLAGSRGKGRGELPPAIVDRAILIGAPVSNRVIWRWLLFACFFGAMTCADTYASMGNDQVDVRRHLDGDERSMHVVFVLLMSIERLVYASPQDRQD